MMVEAYKHFNYIVLSCLILGVLSLVLCGCGNQRVINTNKMPGHKVSDIIKPLQKPKGKEIIKTKSGVYIYKDNTTTNTSGYNFKVQTKTNVEPNEIKFDAEKTILRY